MSCQPSLCARRAGASSQSLPPATPTTLAIGGGCPMESESRCAVSRISQRDTGIELSANEARQGELSLRSLYVLISSLALATFAMSGIAIIIR
jgi:hypothetical protein